MWRGCFQWVAQLMASAQVEKRMQDRVGAAAGMQARRLPALGLREAPPIRGD